MRWCSPFLLSFSLSYLCWVAAVAVNRTIDDTLGDLVTGSQVLYLPKTAGVWEDVSCSDCVIVPDRSQAFRGTWTAATYKPALKSISFQLSFTGTAIYVFFILANNVRPGIATETACTFTLDGRGVGSFSHIPTTSTLLEYNSLVFSRENLANTAHTLTVTTSGITDRDIFVNFDYALYTFDDTPIITSSPSPSPSPSPSSPQISPSSTSSTSQTTSRSSPTTDSSSTHSFSSTTSGSVASQSTDQSQPASTSTTSDNSSSQEEQNESKTNVGAIAGGVAGGVVALVGFLVLLFLLCRRRRERAQYQPAAAFATDGSSDVAPASRSVITPYPIDMGHTTAQYQNRPVTQSDFLQSGIVASPYSADPPAPQPIYGYHKGQATRGPYYDGGANSSGHNRTDSEPQSSYNGSTTGIYPYGGIATSEVSSSPGPGYSMASHVAVLQGGDREALRRARQAELANQVQAITREMSDLKRRPSLVPPNTGSTNPAIVEMDEMREEMRVMREQLEYLRQQQQSAWAQGLSDEAPPGYSRRESHT